MRRVKTRGPARMRELGKKAVVVWLDAADLKKLDERIYSWESRADFARTAILAAIEKTPVKKR